MSRIVARFVVTLFLSGFVSTFRVQEAYASLTGGISSQLSIIHPWWER